MPEPTIYFPENIHYEVGFKRGRLWNTSSLPSPSGRNQKRKQWIRPKRQMQATIYPTTLRGFIIGVDGRSNEAPDYDLTNDDVLGTTIMPFLDAVAGRFNNFFIFNPREQFLWNHRSGHWNGGGEPLPITWPGDLPYSFDFRGPFTGLVNATVATVEVILLYPVAGGFPLAYEAADFTIGSVGQGRETTLIDIVPTISPDPAPIAGDYNMYVNVSHAHERIPAEMTSDQEQMLYNWAMAQPDTEIVIDLEESFG